MKQETKQNLNELGLVTANEAVKESKVSRVLKSKALWGGLLIPLLGLACAASPDISAGTPFLDTLGNQFAWNPESTILNVGTWGGAIGGGIALLKSLGPVGQAMADEKNPLPASRALKGLLRVFAFEFFENAVKTSALLTGLGIFFYDVSPESVKTVGSIATAGLGIQTLQEFITETFS